MSTPKKVDSMSISGMPYMGNFTDRAGCVMTEKILAIMFVKTIWEGYEINTDLLTLF